MPANINSIVILFIVSSTLLSIFRYHLKDVIVGKIYFLLVRIKIKHMELAIIKRETTGTGKKCAVPWSVWRLTNSCMLTDIIITV